MPEDRLFLTVEETSDSLRLSRSKVYELIATCDLPSIKVGRSRRVPVDGLREWARRQTDGEG
jgi:excisionase family DNA binding protein